MAEQGAHSTLRRPLLSQIQMDLFLDIACQEPNAINQDTVRELHLLRDTRNGVPTDLDWDQDPRRGAQRRLEGKLEERLGSIAEYFHADDWDRFTAEERREKTRSLPKDMESLEENITATRTELDAVHRRVEKLASQINKVHSQLQADLSEVISKYAPEMRHRRCAANDVVASTIETSLIRLSLIRARAHQALYDRKATTDRQAKMAEAVSRAYVKLKGDERTIEEEGLGLERELGEYERMLKIGGGFGQVVEDWTRVQMEKEECQRDLGRLGWTGDVRDEC